MPAGETGRKPRQTVIISDPSSGASMETKKISNLLAFAGILSDSAFLGTFTGAEANGGQCSFNLLSFLLESPALLPLSDATRYRTFLARHEVSDSKTQNHAGSSSGKLMSWQ